MVAEYWKQRLYAFLLRRILDPYLEVRSAKQLHDTIEVSIQEGKFVLKDVSLDACFVTQQLQDKGCPGLTVKSVNIQRLEINLRLRENKIVSAERPATAVAGFSYTTNETDQSSSSLAWRALKLGTVNESLFPAVSLIAEIVLDGIFVEIEPVRYSQRHPKTRWRQRDVSDSNVHSSTGTSNNEKIASSSPTSSTKSVIGSYIDAALKSLQLKLKINGLEVKLFGFGQMPRPAEEECCHRLLDRNNDDTKELLWMTFRLSSFIYNELNVSSAAIISKDNCHTPPTSVARSQRKNGSSVSRTVEISDILVQIGRSHTSTTSPSTEQPSTIALIQGTGRALHRIIENSYNDNESDRNISCRGSGGKNCALNSYHDVEVTLNHQVNVSVDYITLVQLEKVLGCYRDMTKANYDIDDEDEEYDGVIDHSAREARHIASLKDNPHFRQDSNTDDADLKVLTGILSQYKEAYYLAEKNQLRGGILVPSNAYLDEAQLSVEEFGDDDTTFDVFFDANEHSFYNTASNIHNSLLLGSDGGSDNNQIEARASIHLESACLKVAFRDLNGDTLKLGKAAEEYILVTISDVNTEVTSATQASEVIFTVMHFEVEDAYRTKPDDSKIHYATSSGKCPVTEDAIEIGSLLTFHSEGSADRGTDDGDFVVSQAPCMRISLKRVRSTRERSNDTVCDVSILPINFFLRQQTFGNLSAFMAHMNHKWNTVATSSSHTPASNTFSDRSPNDDENDGRFIFTANCSSLSLLLPLGQHVSISNLFRRGHKDFTDFFYHENALGVSFERLSFDFGTDRNDGIELSTGNGKNTEIDMSISTDGVFFFALCSEGSQSGFDGRMLQRDFFVIGGRNEVIPQSPVLIRYIKFRKGRHQECRYRDHFPIVPSISSFKSRQEDDEDDEVPTKQSWPSSISSASVPCLRPMVRGIDPQTSMLNDVEKSTTFVSIDIPQILADVTKDELSTLLLLISTVTQINVQGSSTACYCRHKQESTDTARISRSHPISDCEYLSVTINFNEALLSAREDASNLSPGSTVFATHIALNTLRLHVLLLGNSLKHCRMMIHDLCVYASYGTAVQPVSSPFFEEIKSKVGSGRTEQFRSLVTQHGESSISPLIYRSYMFTPISQESPSILIDYVDSPSRIGQSSPSAVIKQSCVYLTLYHLTGRLLVDSDWPERLKSIIPTTHEDADSTLECTESSARTATEPTMTKIFVTAADINIDYQTPSYFNTSSRSIFRVSDCRLSCSLLTPATIVQAFSISIGDISYDIGNAVPYDDEDACLCGAVALMKRGSKVWQYTNKSVVGNMPEAVLRELSFVNILTLDNLSAVIVFKGPATESSVDQRRILDVLLTLGTFSIAACKDSFECFVATLSELQVKLTGLTDEDIQKMKEEQDDCSPIHKSNAILPSLQTLEDYESASAVSATSATRGASNYGSYLLDGYAWTSIDHDSAMAAETQIPPGTDHVAFWYSENARLSGRMIQHHFSLRATADPLADGDMGVQKYAGKAADVTLKTRLLVQKLNVKLRLFDGYDWPEKCTSMEREAISRQGRAFVIDPLPPSIIAERKKAMSAAVADTVTRKQQEALARKAKLMGELLDSSNDDDPITFKDTPLPQTRVTNMANKTFTRLCSRQINTFFQVSLNGVSCRMDSYQDSPSHRLQSILEVSVSKLFVAETVSHAQRPVKMLGDWIDDSDHPRDTRCGSWMLKMATWTPITRISSSNEINSDDCEVTMQLLPMRCILDQRAISFARAFFNKQIDDDDSDDDVKDSVTKSSWSDTLHVMPPPRFCLFKVKPWKVKVDYLPQKIDINALREGSVVELVNIAPIHRMVITLSEVNVVDSDGGGPAFSQIVSSWVREICATQLHKFLANAQPFEPITDVGQGLSDLVVLPYEAFKNGESVQRAMTKGFANFAEVVAFQTLTTASGLTKGAADIMSEALKHSLALNALPRGSNAVDSLAAGFQAAKIVLINQDYNRKGVTGAMSSLVYGIPVLLVGPLTGVSDAAAYTFLGARNVIRPDIMKDEDATTILD